MRRTQKELAMEDRIFEIQDEVKDLFSVILSFSNIDMEEKSVHISCIRSPKASHGNGTAALLYTIAKLRKYGIYTVSLMACPMGGAWSTPQHSKRCMRLVGWYEKIGFKKGEVTMSSDGKYLISADMEMDLGIAMLK